MLNSNPYNKPLDDKASMGNWWCYVPNGTKPPEYINGGLYAPAPAVQTQATYVNPETTSNWNHFECDRCGDIEDVDEMSVILVGAPGDSMKFETHCICPTCLEAYYDWYRSPEYDF